MTAYSNLKEELIKKPRTWLITGVAGFIGSNLLEALLNLNQKVIGLDNFETGYQHNIDQAIEDVSILTEKNIKKIKQDFVFIDGDIRELKDCQKACVGVDYVLHQAALGSVPRSLENPINTNEVNISGFLNMLVASKESPVRRFIYAASSSTYGDHPDLPKIENKIGNPLSPYAITKYTNELYAENFSKIYNMELIGLRYFNVFGENQSPDGPYAAVIPKFVIQLMGHESPIINGDGFFSRDFTYIENVVEANLLAMNKNSKKIFKNGKSHEVFNVALGKSTNLNELFNILSHIKDKIN